MADNIDKVLAILQPWQVQNPIQIVRSKPRFHWTDIKSIIFAESISRIDLQFRNGKVLVIEKDDLTSEENQLITKWLEECKSISQIKSANNLEVSKFTVCEDMFFFCFECNNIDHESRSTSKETYQSVTCPNCELDNEMQLCIKISRCDEANYVS